VQKLCFDGEKGHGAHDTAMRRFLNPLLLFAAHSRRADLIRQIL
jgi:hypothetical protein